MNMQSRITQLEKQARPRPAVNRLTIADITAMIGSAEAMRRGRDWLRENITDQDAAAIMANDLDPARALELETLIETSAPAELRAVIDRVAATREAGK